MTMNGSSNGRLEFATGLEFAKGHGTGNDFVLLPDPDGRLDLPPELVAALCDRRFGLGGDGVLRVVRTAAHPDAAGYVPPGTEPPEWFMDYRNADGSVSEMCGNGIRVFVRYLVDSGLVDTDGTSAIDLPVLTRSGPVPTTVDRDLITAELRRPRWIAESSTRLAGYVLAGAVYDCGNPHLVCPLPDGLDLAALDLTGSPAVDPAVFGAGANVEFVSGHPAVGAGSAAPPTVRMRVHERGVGETLSCGSGACAVAAAVLREADRVEGTVVVDVPGGRLTVALTADACRLTGPASLIARGTVSAAGIGAAMTAAALAGRTTVP